MSMRATMSLTGSSPPPRSASTMLRRTGSASVTKGSECMTAHMHICAYDCRQGSRERAKRASAVALGLFVVAEVGERSDQVHDLLSLDGGEVDELQAHARIDVVVAARAIGVDPHHAPFQVQLRAAGRREAQVDH